MKGPREHALGLLAKADHDLHVARFLLECGETDSDAGPLGNHVRET